MESLLTDKCWGIDRTTAPPAATPPAAPVAPASERSAGYFAAEYSRITSSLVAEARHINTSIRYQGYTLLARSRQLADNNPYAVKFFQMVVNNVCGPSPFILQGKVKTKSGKSDTQANSAIEAAWARWKKPGICDYIKRLSLDDIFRLAIRTVARDGECLIRIYEGATAGPFGIQLQVVDTDRLDYLHNEELANGNVVHAGVEVDQEGRTVAYHLLKRRPTQWQMGGRYIGERIRVPADQIIHLFIPLSAEQIRGIPWMYAVMITLHQLGMFDEAAVIAARVGAAKMGFFERTADYVPPCDEQGNPTEETDTSGARITDADPGTFEELPQGLKFSQWTPDYPSDQYGTFKTAALRGLAAGLSVNHPVLAQDFGAVNFSSLRGAVLEEREHWMELQNWFIEYCCIPIYERWLQMATLSGKLTVNGSLEKYQSINFQGRRWTWVDPLKDVQSNIEAIKWGLKSRTECVSEAGGDMEDTLDMLAAENDMAKAKGVDIAPADKTIKPDNPDAGQGGTSNA